MVVVLFCRRTSVDPRLGRNRFNFFGQRETVYRPVIQFYVAVAGYTCQRVLHPVLVVPVREVLPRMCPRGSPCAHVPSRPLPAHWQGGSGVRMSPSGRSSRSASGRGPSGRRANRGFLRPAGRHSRGLPDRGTPRRHPAWRVALRGGCWLSAFRRQRVGSYRNGPESGREPCCSRRVAESPVRWSVRPGCPRRVRTR